MANVFVNPLDTAPTRSMRPVSASGFSGGAQRPAEKPFQDFLPSGPQQKPTPLISPSALNHTRPVAKPIEIPAVQTSFPISEPKTEPRQESLLSNQLDAIEKPVVSEGRETIAEESVEVVPYQFTVKTTVSNDTDAEPVQVPPGARPIPDVSVEPLPAIHPVEEESVAPATDMSYTIQKGDTLSHIVASTLRDQGIDYSTRDLYNMVRTVASANGLRDANFIMVGQTIDLSAVHGGIVAQKSEENPLLSLAEGLNAPVQGRITSHFGMRIHPILGEEHHHNGVDIAAPTGTPVAPVKPGVVTFAGDAGSYGQMVEIDHKDGTRSRYAHLSEVLVTKGDAVMDSIAIGAVGSTGRSTGPHLHLEIHKNGNPVDPLNEIPETMIAMR